MLDYSPDPASGHIAQEKALSHVRGNPDDYEGFVLGGWDDISDYLPSPIVWNNITFQWHRCWGSLGDDAQHHFTMLYEANNGFRIERDEFYHCTLTNAQGVVIDTFYDNTI